LVLSMKIKHFLAGLAVFTVATALTTDALAEESFRLKRGGGDDDTPAPSSHFQTARIETSAATGGADDQNLQASARAPLSANITRNAVNAGVDTNQFQTQTATSAPLQANLNNTQRPPLSANINKNDLTSVEVQDLGKHDIVLIIDKSSSMETMDCPSPNSGAGSHLMSGLGNLLGGMAGFGGGGFGGAVSRWDWCGMQAHDLARQVDPVLPQGMSVVLFSGSTKIFSNVKASEIPNIFTSYHPGGFTNTAMAVGQTLEDYFQRREAAKGNVKPMLVAVITDGCPTNPEALCSVIKNATHYMKNPNEIKIEILQIGGDPKGFAYAEALDNRLVAPYGGRDSATYDIVSTVTFPELVHHGLARTMLECATGQRR
jgi:Mg-chelatase subunit ChlD